MPVFVVAFFAIAVATVVLILAPLRRSAEDDAEVGDRELLAEREAALQALRELRFDYQLGNLDEDDFRELRQQQQRHALALLAHTGREPASGPTDTTEEIGDRTDREIEEAVRALRRRRREAAATARTTAGRSPAASARDIVGSAPRRALRWAVGGGLALAVALGGIAWLYLSSRPDAAGQQPLTQLPAQVADVRAIAYLAGPGETVVMGSLGGLLVSEDGGRTWPGRFDVSSVASLAANPSRPQAVYALGDGVILSSDDGGRVWTPMPTDLPGASVSALAADPANSDVLYAVIRERGLFRSEDGGAHWTLIDRQAPATVTGLAVVGSAGTSLFVATSDQGVLSSADGLAWAGASGVLGGALPTRRISSLAYDSSSGDSYVGSDGSRFTGALYVGSDLGVYKSVDGGGSWRRLPLEADVAAIAVDPDDSRVLLVVTRGNEVYRSEDRGLTWGAR